MSKFHNENIIHRPYCCTSEAACSDTVVTSFDKNGFCVECGIDQSKEERVLSVSEYSIKDEVTTLVKKLQIGQQIILMIAFMILNNMPIFLQDLHHWSRVAIICRECFFN